MTSSDRLSKILVSLNEQMNRKKQYGVYTEDVPLQPAPLPPTSLASNEVYEYRSPVNKHRYCMLIECSSAERCQELIDQIKLAHPATFTKIGMADNGSYVAYGWYYKTELP